MTQGLNFSSFFNLLATVVRLAASLEGAHAHAGTSSGLLPFGLSTYTRVALTPTAAWQSESASLLGVDGGNLHRVSELRSGEPVAAGVALAAASGCGWCRAEPVWRLPRLEPGALTGGAAELKRPSLLFAAAAFGGSGVFTCGVAGGGDEAVQSPPGVPRPERLQPLAAVPLHRHDPSAHLRCSAGGAAAVGSLPFSGGSTAASIPGLPAARWRHPTAPLRHVRRARRGRRARRTGRSRRDTTVAAMNRNTNCLPFS